MQNFPVVMPQVSDVTQRNKQHAPTTMPILVLGQWLPLATACYSSVRVYASRERGDHLFSKMPDPGFVGSQNDPRTSFQDQGSRSAKNRDNFKDMPAQHHQIKCGSQFDEPLFP